MLVLGLMDRWVLSHLAALVTTADKSFKAYDLHLVTQTFLTFWQNHLCDVYLVSHGSVSLVRMSHVTSVLKCYPGIVMIKNV